MLIPKNANDLGIIMEFKKISPYEQTDLDSAAASALKQIKDKNYQQELRDRGISQILYLGLAFQGKKVLISSQRVYE
ncbi:MAG: PD-(D/E)XK nuclease domain-containing protein [Candidatus Protochlamydia sp.]|nr:PD-(D/E)XK nuclease domain-containing protein [Candidatus Protochlamydia sp.]